MKKIKVRRAPRTYVEIPDIYPSGGPFHSLLAWHLLRNGTRPDNSSGKWTAQDLASVAFGGDAKLLASNAKKISNWLLGKNAPKSDLDLKAILLALFGLNDNEPYRSWRRELRDAAERDREKNRPSNPTLVTQPIRLSPPWRPHPIIGFVGRDELLTRVHTELSTAPAPIALHGTPGIGKTSLAIEYANRYSRHYGGVWSSSAEMDVTFGLAKLATKLGLVSDDEVDVEKAAFEVLDALAQAETPWLLIYDNAPDLQAVRRFLPSGKTRLLITSRFPKWFDGVRDIRIGTLSEQDASGLLNMLAERSDHAGATALAQTLGWLPLALNQAGATCALLKMGFPEYNERVEELLDERQASATEYPNSVFATFTIAIEAITQKITLSEAHAVETLIAYLAECSPEPIPSELAEAAIANERDYYRAQTLLLSTSIIQRSLLDDGTSALVVHRLVQNVARMRSRDAGTADRVVTRLMNRIAEIFPSDPTYRPTAWPKCERLIPHILSLRDRQLDRFVDAEDGLTILIGSSDYLRGREVIDLSLSLLESALVCAERKYGADCRSAGGILTSMSGLHVGRGDLAAAHQTALRALSIYRKCDQAVESTASCLNALASVQMIRGEVREAIARYQEAIEMLEGEATSDPELLQEALVGIGSCLMQSGEFDRGLEFFKTRVAFSRNSYGSDNLRIVGALWGLGMMLSVNLATREQAHEYLAEALQICEAQLGDHGYTADVLVALGELELKNGRRNAAMQRLERAYEIQERGLGPNHYRTAETAHLLATSRFDGVDWSGMLAAAEHLFSIRIQTFGANHRLAVASAFELGLLYYGQREFVHARPLLKSVAAFFEATPEIEVEHYVNAQVALGLTEFQVGDTVAAEATLKKITEPFRTRPDVDVSKMAIAIFYLGEIAWNRHQIDLALDEYQRSLSLFRERGPASGRSPGLPESTEFLAENGQDAAAVARRVLFHNLGYHLFQCGNDIDAQLAFEVALEFDPYRLGEGETGLPSEIAQATASLDGIPGGTDLLERVETHVTALEVRLGSDHPVVHAVRSLEAVLHFRLGKSERANAVALNALNAQARLLGYGHPWTQTAKARLDRILAAQGEKLNS